MQQQQHDRFTDSPGLPEEVDGGGYTGVVLTLLLFLLISLLSVLSCRMLRRQVVNESGNLTQRAAYLFAALAVTVMLAITAVWCFFNVQW